MYLNNGATNGSVRGIENLKVGEFYISSHRGGGINNFSQRGLQFLGTTNIFDATGRKTDSVILNFYNDRGKYSKKYQIFAADIGVIPYEFAGWHKTNFLFHDEDYRG